MNAAKRAREGEIKKKRKKRERGALPSASELLEVRRSKLRLSNSQESRKLYFRSGCENICFNKFKIEIIFKTLSLLHFFMCRYIYIYIYIGLHTRSTYSTQQQGVEFSAYTF